jgi:hypothetical protein
MPSRRPCTKSGHLERPTRDLFARLGINHHCKTSMPSHRSRVSIAVGRAREATPINNDIGFEDKSCASRPEKRC